jgi:hypothetical protein
MLGDLVYGVYTLFLREPLSDSLISAGTCYFSTGSFSVGGRQLRVIVNTGSFSVGGRQSKGINGDYICLFLFLSHSRRCFLDTTSG